MCVIAPADAAGIITAVPATFGFCCCSCSGDTAGRPPWEKKLLQLFSLAQSIEDAPLLQNYLLLNPAATPDEQRQLQRLEAARIVASLDDDDTIRLHSLAVKVVKEADTSRCIWFICP